MPGVTFVYPAGEGWLNGKASSVHSQNGEDGLIAATFARIGEQSRFCFEVGCGDGVYLSNTMALREQGWGALLIDIDRDQVDLCKGHECSNVRAMCADVTHAASTIDSLLATIPSALRSPGVDFGVIDIDCHDWHVWNGLKAQPRVMLVEYNFKRNLPPPDPLCDHRRHQAGIDAILSLGASKGYVPLARTLCNVLFAKESEL